MRKLKRFASVLLALVMCFGLTVTAFADGDTYSITINNSTEGYTYAAYQVFAGTLESDGSLSGITWGSGVDGDALVTALQAASGETGNTLYDMFPSSVDTAEEVAAVLAGDDFTEAMVKAFAEIVDSNLTTTCETSNWVAADSEYTISGLAAGYYLVKNTVVPTDGAYTSYILKVVADVDAEHKTEVPTFTKTIDDINDSTDTTSAVSTTDSADYDINDPVPYTLTATLPSNYADYDTYTLVFHDMMDTDYLEFNENSVVVTVKCVALDDSGNVLKDDNDNTLYVTYTVSTSDYTIKTAVDSETEDYGGHTTTNDCTFEIVIENTKDLTVTSVTYDANMTDAQKSEVVVASDKIPVTSTSQFIVNYTATLKSGAGYAAWNYAYLEFSNNPNVGGSGDTGTTPEEEVVVITLKLEVTKTDTSNNALTGAGFTLYKYDADSGEFEATSVTASVTDNIFTWDGLDDGYYILVETTVPTGYVGIAPICFKVEATHSETPDGTNLATSYAEVLSSLTVTPITSLSDLTADLTDLNTTTLTSLLKNALNEDDDYEISFYSSASLSKDEDTGKISTTIANSKTSSLPSTGGIGTTIFYVVGGVLVVGAVVLLITRKRMQDDQ